MKILNFATKLMFFLWIYYVTYNSIFGWNKLPINNTEVICDNIFKYGMFFAIILYLSPLLKIYENIVKRNLDDK